MTWPLHLAHSPTLCRVPLARPPGPLSRGLPLDTRPSVQAEMTRLTDLPRLPEGGPSTDSCSHFTFPSQHPLQLVIIYLFGRL